MEKLTIKELAPYLPYKIEYVGSKFINDGNIFTMNVNTLFHDLKYFESGSIKPILRPLSDLTKEIEVNGERFVPITKLITHGFHNSFWYDLETFDCKYLYNYDIEILLELHFDIYRLIEKGLAINKNTI